jgi:hypothetical protein
MVARRSLIGALLLTSVSALPAVARECRDVTDRASFAELNIAEVKPDRARVSFSNPVCTATAAKACEMKAFVVPGDVVLVGEVFDAAACAIFVNAKGQLTSGLLPNASLRAPKVKLRETSDALVGNWTRTEASMFITPTSKGTLSVTGQATYGATDKGRVTRGAVNMGEVAFAGQPKANRIADGWDKKDDPACAVDMIALGPYLVVADNRACGGANVSFTGIYRRR